jgi:hypothetical protein
LDFVYYDDNELPKEEPKEKEDSIKDTYLSPPFNVVNSDPNEEKIKWDLAGHIIMEPTRTLYRKEFKIQSTDNVRNVSILEKVKNENEIFYAVHLNLSGEVNDYIADINITYILSNKGWTIQYIESKQLNIVSTGKYNNCVSTQLVESTWGGIYTMRFTNNCDIVLLVEGVALYNNKWHYFSALIDANDSREANSDFVDVKDYIIERIERP